MRTIRFTNRFKKDFRREKSGRHGKYLEEELGSVLRKLQTDEPLAARHVDHALTGAWSDCRDCHVRPDLILIYRKPDDVTLELVRLGSHSELGF